MKVLDLGVQPYETVWRDMQVFTDARSATAEDELWLVEHPPVFTLGKNGKPEHVLKPGGIPVLHSDRGGQVTYHGPGQLVVYVLLDLQRMQLGVRELVTRLENSVIELLAEFEICAEARRDAPGVYVAGEKIAALGLRVRKGRCFHGLALNVDMDLEPFTRIHPCGYRGLRVTQLRNLLKHGSENVTLAAIKPRLVNRLQQQLQ
jgi:lipoyl(octanoyl) transferase